MRVAACLLDRDDLLVDVAEPAGEERAAVDHHVDLVRAGLDGGANVRELHLERRLAGGKRGGDRRDLDALPSSARRATPTRLG